MLGWVAALGLPLSLLAGPWFIFASMYVLFGTGLVMGATAVGFVVPFGTLYVLWNRLLHPRQVGRVVVTQTQLQTATGTIELEHLDPAMTLRHTPYGARLDLSDGTQRRVLHGDHAVLAAVVQHLHDRPPTASVTPAGQPWRADAATPHPRLP